MKGFRLLHLTSSFPRLILARCGRQAIFWSTGRYTLQAADYRNRREDQNLVNAAVGGFLPAREQKCNRPAAFKNATVRERPFADVLAAPVWFNSGDRIYSGKPALRQ